MTDTDPLIDGNGVAVPMLARGWIRDILELQAKLGTYEHRSS